VADSTPATIDLAVFDRVELPESMKNSVFAEAEEVLLELGAQVVWHVDSSRFRIYDPGNEIQIILSSSRPEKWRFSSRVMGAVVPIGKYPRQVVFIFASDVSRLLDLPGTEKLPYRPPDNRRFAKALGRVIAHELVHAIAPEHPHANNGIMLGSHRASSLLDPQLTVDTSCATAFRAALREIDTQDETSRLGSIADTRN